MSQHITPPREPSVYERELKRLEDLSIKTLRDVKSMKRLKKIISSERNDNT